MNRIGVPWRPRLAILQLGVSVALFATVLAAASGRPRDPAAEVAFLGCVVNGANFDCQYRLTWPDDGAGPIDSIDVVDQVLTPTAGPTQMLGLGGQPVSPVTLTVHRPRPSATLTMTGSLQAKLVRRNLPGPVTVRSWSYTEPDVAPPPVTIDTLVIGALWAEPRDIERDSVENGVVVFRHFGPVDSVERCVFVQFGDSAVGRWGEGGARSTNCTARLAGHVARWGGLSAQQQAIVDTLRVTARFEPDGARLVLVTRLGSPPALSGAGWVPMPVAEALPPFDTLPWPRLRVHGTNGGGWRQTVLGYARP